jgi:hypothetical protein
MPPAIAYLSRGRLLVRRDGEAVREVQSDFARESMERELRNQKLHGWKGQSGIWGNMGIEPAQFADWQNAEPRRVIRFASVTPGDGPGELFYVLDLGAVGGLFRYDLAANREQRLMHRNGFSTNDLSRHPETGAIAVAVPRDDGTVGIAVGENDGRYLSEATVGDCIDEAPTWVRGNGRALVYQSAGIGRDERGFSVGLGPYRLERIDMESKAVETLLEVDGYDLLQPRQLADGTLFYIRRPYKPHGEVPGPLEVLKDVVLFPYRLLRAVFHFLNFMSVAFSGKPLTTAGAGGVPGQRRPEPRHLALWGQVIDTKRAMAKAGNDEPANLVPREWTLVRRAPDGTETDLAEHVLAYDVTTDGTVVVTNGTRVTWIDAAGRRHELARDTMIERVVALAP